MRVSTLHSSLDQASSRVAGIVWRIAAKLSSRFDAVVACSPSARDFAVEFGYRFPGEQIRIVHNGSVTAAAPAPEPSGDPLLLHLGRHAPSKDHPTLFAAFARVLQRHPRARLVCAGHRVDPENTELTRELERLGIDHAVTLRGSVSDVRGLIRSAHAMVFSSNHEALPMAGIEALGKGSPWSPRTRGTHGCWPWSRGPWCPCPIPRPWRTPCAGSWSWAPGSATSCVVAAGSWPGTSSTSAAPPGATASSTRS